MKDDEKQLLLAIYNAPEGIYIREFIEQQNIKIHPKRVEYILEKWADKNWYEYGVSVMAGWLTEEGKQIAADIQAAEKVREK